MEVAFFTDSYPPMRDGVAAVTGGLARTLSRLGHTVRVYAPNPRPGPASEETRNGVTIRRVRTVPVPLYGQYRWPLWPFGLLRRDRGVQDADVIHLHTPGLLGTMAFLASRRFRRPLVGTFHTNIREMQESVPAKMLVPTFFRVAAWYNLGTYWRCDVATAPSEAARDSLLSGATKPFHHPIEVIPNGIDVERFRPDTPVPDWRARCGLPSAPLVTYLGRLTVDKGVHRFLDAVETAIPRTDLVAIVGGLGPEEGRVRERLAANPQLAARVRYVGPVAETEKAALLSQSDLFVLPSTSDTSSVALLEAMACGTPVIAPSSGGASEIVEEGVTGWRVAVTDPGALAASLQRILDETEIRRKVGGQAAEFVRETASLEMMARRFISLYRLVEEERPLRDGGIPS
ncbi:MAG: glycosyltransferase [Thermoplasmata archaeon]|nr:glycosyltransferase [Thermoplasmata archaeon]